MKSTKLASVLDEFLELPNGQMIELDSPKFAQWLEGAENRSFRFEYGFAGEQSFTARKETSKKGQGDYWYGYRKVEGKLHKRYIGKSADITRYRLQEIAVALDTPACPRTKPASYINNYVTEGGEQSKPPSYINDYVTQSQLDNCHQRCEVLEAELERLQEMRDHLQQEHERLAGELAARHASRSQQPDLESSRDRFLASLPVGKQAPEYKRTKKAIDSFIAFVQSL